MRNVDKEFIKNAYSSVAMYHNLAEELHIDIQNIESMEELPVITKDMAIINDSMLAANSIPLLYRNELRHSRTSGSTGKYMDIYWKKVDYNKSMLPLWILRKKYYDINPNDRLCFFYTDIDLENEQEIYRKGNKLGFLKSNLDISGIKQIYEEMLEFQPKWMLLQPSIGVMLCECIEKFGLKHIESLKYIEMSGEILTDSVRKLVKKAFGCTIANQYGANEFNSIAYECPKGNMHLMEQNVYVEVMNNKKRVEDEIEGELCITTKTNSAMPLIRYAIGDTGIIKNKRCTCGNKNKILELTSGRVSDYILCEDGSKLSSYIFVRGMDVVNYELDNVIKQFQIIQQNINQFNIVLVIDYEDIDRTQNIEEVFTRTIKNIHLKNAQYNFEYLTNLMPNDSNGKFSYFKRMIN